MHVREYIEVLRAGEEQLASALIDLAVEHEQEPDLGSTARLLASWSLQHAQALGRLSERFRLQERAPTEAAPPCAVRQGPHEGRLGLLHDLEATCAVGQDVHLRWTVLGQTARALHDPELAAISADLGGETDRQLAWLRTLIVAMAPQVLVMDP